MNPFILLEAAQPTAGESVQFILTVAGLGVLLLLLTAFRIYGKGGE